MRLGCRCSGFVSLHRLCVMPEEKKMKNDTTALNGSWSASLRVQLDQTFDFAACEKIIPMLAAVGYRWLYLSPIWSAVPGSTHFYNVIDHNSISDELGGEDAFRRMVATLKRHGMHLLADFVPNHGAAHPDNNLWTYRRDAFFDTEPGTGVYRRFWDFGEMAALRQELPHVFRQTHRKLLSLVRQGLVEAIRIDHPEGLADPYDYARRLKQAAPGCPIYFEKAHRPGTNVPPGMMTVGYEWWWDVERLMGSSDGRKKLIDFWQKLTGESRTFRQIATAKRREAARFNFRPDAQRLHRLLGIEEVSEDDIVRALACFFDRTYIDLKSRWVTPRDRRQIERARMHKRLKAVLLLEEAGHDDFVSEFQAVLIGVCGRGEHAARFLYTPVLSRCEHGCEPDPEGLSVKQFHLRNRQRAVKYSRGLLAGSTHDSYRSQDCRSMLDALSYFADEWATSVVTWRSLNAALRVGDAAGLSVADEMFIYQTLLSAEGIGPDRLVPYVIKSCREGGLTCNWSDGDKPYPADDSYRRWGVQNLSGYERGIEQFIHGLFGADHPFMSSFRQIEKLIKPAGRQFALAALVLRLTAPGMADVYQGDDLWLHNLLDPDNRRCVDWQSRQEMFAHLQAGAPPTLENVKLWIIWKVLQLRLAHQRSFMGRDSYSPVNTGDEAVVAYRRGSNIQVWVSLAPDHTFSGPGGDWHNLLEPLNDIQELGGKPFAAVYVR
jgi:(1->4)-alpha-D-glucan 1-alpha-D-glucosylmutase